MKLFFVIALLCGSIVSFGQSDANSNVQPDMRSNRVCGEMYSRAWAERMATIEAVNNFYSNPDEAYVSTTYEWHAGIGWCYTNTYQCVLEPLNKEIVPDVVKVIQSQECDLKQASTFTEF